MLGVGVTFLLLYFVSLDGAGLLLVNACVNTTLLLISWCDLNHVEASTEHFYKRCGGCS